MQGLRNSCSLQLVMGFIFKLLWARAAACASEVTLAASVKDVFKGQSRKFACRSTGNY